MYVVDINPESEKFHTVIDRVNIGDNSSGEGLAPGTHHLDSDLLDQFLRGYRPGDPIDAVYRYEHGTAGQHRTLDDLTQQLAAAAVALTQQPPGA